MPPDDSLETTTPAAKGGEAAVAAAVAAATATPAVTLEQVRTLVGESNTQLVQQINSALAPVFERIAAVMPKAGAAGAKGAAANGEGAAEETPEDYLRRFWENPKSVFAEFGEQVKKDVLDAIRPVVGLMASDRYEEIRARVQANVDEWYGKDTFKDEVATDFDVAIQNTRPEHLTSSKVLNTLLAGVLGKDQDRRDRLSDRRTKVIEEGKRMPSDPAAMLVGGHRAPREPDTVKPLAERFLRDREEHTGERSDVAEFMKQHGFRGTTLTEFREFKARQKAAEKRP